MTADQNISDAHHEANGAPPQVSQQESSFAGSSNIPHGMGQSKSSRRRRRKRKSKTDGDQGEATVSSSSAESSSHGGNLSSLQAAREPSAAVAESASRPQSFQANAAQSGSNTGEAGGKRWKKKFRDRQRAGGPAENNGGGRQNGHSGGAGHSNGASASTNPGSNGGGSSFRGADTHQFGNNAGGGFKRKGGSGGFSGGGGKQRDRGPRSFVGPMDHSYRAVNGNFAEAPPSTIPSHSNGNYGGRSPRASYQSDAQPIDYSQGRPIPIAEDAPTKILFFIEDLFFLAKIQETARKLGVKVAFMKNEKEAIATLTSAEEADRPGLIVFDLNNANAKPLTLIPKLKAKLKRSTSIIGFLSHLQGDLKAKAVEAGCDTVMPRSAFSQNLPNLLRRYGIVEEEEANFNM